MQEDKELTPEKLSLKQLSGMLTVGQTRAVIVATIAIIGGAFSAGMWANEIRLAHSYKSELDKMVPQGQHDKEMAELTKKHEAQLKKEAGQRGTIAEENQRYTLQIEFLERCHAYLNARIKGRENYLNGDFVDEVNDSRKLFAETLSRLYKEGDRNRQKLEGYEFDESEAGNHKIIFGNVKTYRIPVDVKGDFVDDL